MHVKKTAFLILLVAALGFVVSRQFGEEPERRSTRTTALLEEIDFARIARIRIENVGRDLHLSIERDDLGGWYITDPIAFKASDNLVRELIETVRTTPTEVADGVGAEQVGLDRSLAQLDLFVAGDGEPKRHTIEFGALDLGDADVHVRAEGRILRAPRRIFDLVDRNLRDFRETLLLPQASGRAIIGYTRRGSLAVGASRELVPELPHGLLSSYRDTGVIDLALQAFLDEGVWRSSAPLRSRLAPQTAELLFGATARLRASGFVDGLDAEAIAGVFDTPVIEILLDTNDGAQHRLAFVVPVGAQMLAVEDRSWLCGVGNDFSTAFEVDGNTVRALCQPFEAIADPVLFGVVREQIEAVVAVHGEASILLSRNRGRWMVETGAGVRPADAGLVSDWLASIDRVHFDTYIDAAVFPELAPEGRIEIATADRRRQVLELGPLVEIAGAEYRSVRREGEELWGVSSTDWSKLAHVAPESLLSLRLVGAAEAEVGEIRASRGDGAAASWRRESRKGFWQRGTSGLEDRAFAPLVDAAVSPVATRWLDEQADAAGGITVDVALVIGAEYRYVLVDRGDRVLAIWDGLVAELADRRLYDGLAALLDSTGE